MISAFLAATVVAVVQYVRTRDRRLPLLMAMFVLQAMALSEWPADVWKDVSQAGVCLVGLVLVMTLTSRPPRTPRE